MPELNDAAYSENVKRSLYRYVNDNLHVTEGLAVDWPGLKFNNKKHTKWLQPSILDTESSYMRQGGLSGTSKLYAEQVNMLFQINCFAKKSGTTVSYEHYGLRDTVNKYFPVGKQISITDCLELSGNSTTVLDKMEVRRIATDLVLPETNETYAYAIAYEIDYTRLETYAYAIAYEIDYTRLTYEV